MVPVSKHKSKEHDVGKHMVICADLLILQGDGTAGAELWPVRLGFTFAGESGVMAKGIMSHTPVMLYAVEGGEVGGAPGGGAGEGFQAQADKHTCQFGKTIFLGCPKWQHSIGIFSLHHRVNHPSLGIAQVPAIAHSEHTSPEGQRAELGMPCTRPLALAALTRGGHYNGNTCFL